MRHFIRITLSLALLLGLTACLAPPADPDTAEERVQFIAMDTSMVVSTYGKQSTAAARASENLIRNLEAQLSRTEEDSAVSRLNRGETVAPGEDLNGLLNSAGFCHLATDGAFNIAVAPLVSAWGFTTDHNHVPAPAEIDRLLKVVEETVLQGGPEGYSLAPGQSIDLGGIAKGYAADRLADLFQEYELPRAMAQLGGNILAWGDRPDGTPWRVGVQDPARPDHPNAFAGILRLKNSFAVTSGGYQRYFEEDGKRYHHIIDPATGYPADSGLASVTVVANSRPGDCFGTLCDAFSTAFFIMGEEKALDAWREDWRGDLDLVLVTEEGRVVVTQGLAESFTLEEGSGYTLEIVS